jgi:hypothetical protein
MISEIKDTGKEKVIIICLKRQQNQRKKLIPNIL